MVMHSIKGGSELYHWTECGLIAIKKVKATKENKDVTCKRCLKILGGNKMVFNKCIKKGNKDLTIDELKQLLDDIEDWDNATIEEMVYNE